MNQRILKYITGPPKKYEASFHWSEEGSCNSEDWSNDAENSALITEIHFILKYIKIENCYLKLQ